MTALPRALPSHASRAFSSGSPMPCTAKSTMLVVPPNAAATVPVWKSSEANVPPNGSSMWVWTSMPPGMTYFRDASMRFAPPAFRSFPTAATFSSSMRTSALYVSVAVTTVPPVMSVSPMALRPEDADDHGDDHQRDQMADPVDVEKADGLAGEQHLIELHDEAGCRPHQDPDERGDRRVRGERRDDGGERRRPDERQHEVRDEDRRQRRSRRGLDADVLTPPPPE